MEVGMFEAIILVAVGGAIGAALRFLVGHYVDSEQFPWATFTVNLIGAFMLALITFWYTGIPQEMKLLLFTGLFGAFTTMSTFTLETVSLFFDGRVGSAALNFCLNAGLCICGAVAGRYVGIALAG
jgi:crcB protein